MTTEHTLNNTSLDSASVPLVTVTIMSYNNARFIVETVKSVLAQEGVSFELIVHDDCSTDQSVALLQQFSVDPRFKLSVNPKNLGQNENGNRCFHSARGKYYVVMGSDDILYPGHLAKLTAALEANPQCALAFSQCNWIDANNHILQYAIHPGHKQSSYVGGRDEVIDLLSFDNYITPSAVMLRLSKTKQVCLADGNLARLDMQASDWEMWIRVARSFPDFAFLSEATVGYRVHGGQVSQNFYTSERPLVEHLEILEMNMSFPDVWARLRKAAVDIWQLFDGRLAQYPLEVVERFRDRIEGVRHKLFAPEQSNGFVSLVRSQTEQAPFFSVVLTTYNRPAMLRDTLQSLAEQTMADFEVVLVNDCGSPVEEVLADFPSLTIAYLRLAKNSGLSAARNAGLMIARGRYITYLDDDDFYLPDHLAILRQQFEKTPQALVYTDSITVQEDLIDGVRYPLGGQNLYAHQGFSRERLLVHNYIPVNTWSHPAELISQVGGFDISLPSFEDWDMLLRLSERTDVVHIEQVTAEVRQRRQRSSDQMTSQNRAKFPVLYRRIYGRYPVELAEIKAQRQAQLAALEVPPQPTVEEVYREFLSKRKLNQAELDAYADSLRGAALPQFTVVITDSELNDQALVASLKSIAAQYYQQHQVWVVSARDATPANSEQIRWLKWAELDAAIAALPADGLVGVFTAGDTFEQHALLLLAHQHLTQFKSLLTFDADQIDPTGRCHSPQFRAQFDALFQLGTAYLGRSLIVPSEVLQTLALDTQLLQAPHLGWWQLVVLSVFLQHGAKAIAHLPFVLHHQARVLEADADYSQLLQQDYYQLRNKLGQPLNHNGVQRMVAKSLDSQTLIAIEAGLESERLLTSIENLLTGIAGLPAVVVVLDRGADAVAPAVQSLSDIAHPQLQILSCPAEFDVFAWLRSMASQVEWLAYIAGDVCINQPECMPMLLSTMAMNDAQWVAPRLVDGQGRNTGAPLVAGFDDGIKSPLQALPVAEVGYQQRNQALQQSLLLDPRCVLMHRDVLFADVLSGAAIWPLQLIELQMASFANGGMALWEPVAIASTDIPFALELNDVASLIPRYRDLFANDPLYSPNFQRTGQFLLERNRLAGPDLLAWSRLPKALVFPADEFGCGYYRLIHPYHVMEQAGFIRGGVGFEHFSVCDLQRIKPDLILVQRQISPEQIASLARYKAWANCPIVFELDDYILNLPVKSLHRDEMPQGMAASLRKALSYCDRLVVSTPPLAEALQGFHSDIRVAANRLPPSWWSFAATPKLLGEGKPRVGWAGGVGHTGDLLLVADVVAELANEVDWVFFGHCPEALQPYVKEFHPGVEITQYPAKLAALNLDLAIAPLEENLFNRCKSNLKLLEYGACGYPVVCTDFGPYQGDMPVVRVKNRFKDWVDAIRLMLANHDLRLDMAQRLQAEVRANWMLDQAAAAAWCRAWFGQ